MSRCGLICCVVLPAASLAFALSVFLSSMTTPTNPFSSTTGLPNKILTKKSLFQTVLCRVPVNNTMLLGADRSPPMLGLAWMPRNPPGRKDLGEAYLFGPRPPLGFKFSSYVPDSDLQELTGHTLFRVC